MNFYHNEMLQWKNCYDKVIYKVYLLPVKENTGREILGKDIL